MMEREDTDKKFCGILFDVLEDKGVRDVVCSPGSRNAPLLIAAASRDGLRKHVVVDERSAAFMALGIAMVSRRPVAIVCTSGTALLNYGPAVAEAFYQSLPIVVISADRPQQWIDQDDSQTLRQFEAFSNFVKKSYELPAYGDGEVELQWYANRIANDAMIEATSRRPGPVHINVRLGEPLSGKRVCSHQPQRIIGMLASDMVADRMKVKAIGEVVAESRVMFVAGFMPPDSRLQKAVTEFCSLPNVVAMTETLSNLHIKGHSCDIDAVLTAYPEETLDSLAPDLVITVGGSLVSRKLKEYLRRNSDICSHWSLGWHHTTSDCFQSLSMRIEADPARMLRGLHHAAAGHVSEDTSSYSCQWTVAREKAAAAKSAYVASVGWSELRAFDMILGGLPAACNLFLSNGTTVRYAQLLGSRLPHASYCNRGVSGIDGCSSTAVGCAKAYNGMTVLITGDMSMAYDLGALALPDIPDTMRIIVIDNRGGGIFRFIPTTSSLPEREEYFCACPTLPVDLLAPAYGWDYLEAHDAEGLRKALRELFVRGRRKILRVVCDGEESAAILKGYMAVRAE